MPKIIKNLEITICNTALELFCTLNYDEVDMKTIAKNSGIAVGTLYNYFSNKLELYIFILCKSWDITFEKINQIRELEKDSSEKIRILISVLYKDVVFRNGMGNYGLFFSKHTEVNCRLIELKQSISNSLLCFLNDTYDLDTVTANKFIECIFTNLISLIHNYEYDTDNNIIFLSEFAISYLKDKERSDILLYKLTQTNCP
ncbi:MAG: TetR/AcrR family transcriptional regulator [Clostridium sp.]